MIIQGQDLCLGCMHELKSEDTCSYCGLEQKKYHPNPRCLIPGTLLRDRYMLGRVLGEGSFGITYIGWDILLKIPVAVKEYFPTEYVSRDVLCGNDNCIYVYEKKKTIDYKKQLRRFYKEAQVLSRFRELKSIVCVRDFFYANDTAYLVMDYIEGISLKEYVTKRGRLSGEETLKLMDPVLNDLSIVHDYGIIHRDISPDNLLVDEKGKLIVIDFGSARLSNTDWTKTITIMFKRGFSPEEQYHSKGKQGAATDIYALCATMYFMLTGIVPEESVSRMIKDQVVPLYEMSRIGLMKEQKQAIMKGMSIEYEQRYGKLSELVQALYQTAQETKKKWWFSRRTFAMCVVGGILLFLILCSVEGCFLVKKREAKRQTIVTTPEVKGATTEAQIEKVLSMPILSGLTKEQVASQLKELNGVTFLVEWQETTSSKGKKGRVLKQSIPEETELYEGIQYEITLYLGDGKKKKSVQAATTQEVQTTSVTSSVTPQKKAVKKKSSHIEESIDFDGSIE